MNKSSRNLKVKEKSASWLSNHATKIESVLLALLFLFLPTQLGKHFWPNFSSVTGIRVDYLSPTIYTTDILIGLLFVFWMIRFVIASEARYRMVLGEAWQSHSLNNSLRGLPRRFASRNDVWRISFFVSLLMLLLLNVFSADRIGLSLYLLFKLFEFAFLGLYIAHHIRSHVQMMTIGLITSIAVFFESFLAILQYLAQGSLNGWLYYLGERMFTGGTIGIANASINGELMLRPYGTLPHPNVLAGYVFLSSILIGFFLLPKARGFIRIFGILTLVLAGIALLLTLSRVVLGLSFLLLLAGLVYWLVKKRPRPRLRSGLIFAALLDLLLFIGGAAFLQTILTRFTQTSFFEEALVQRGELITIALTILMAHPVIGVGLGHFIPSLAPLQDPLSVGLYLQPVHNIYLLVAAETGIIGLSLFLGMIALTYRRLFLQIRQTPLFRTEFLVLTLLLSSVLVLGLFDHYFLTLQQGQLLFSVILGLCWITFRD